MLTRTLYTAEATSTGDGRNGHVTTSDGRIDLGLAMPPALGGTGEGANPEQLFASEADVTDSTVSARVGIGHEEDEALGLAVTLLIHLPHVAPGTAKELALAAHQVCPYSRATRGNIPVDLQILDQA
jgi:organic hydroperoxide reductase OsmC/OhrA